MFISCPILSNGKKSMGRYKNVPPSRYKSGPTTRYKIVPLTETI